MNDEKWMRYFSDAVFVFSATGAIPRGGRHPGPWVGAQRAAARSGKSSMTANRQALLDEHLPGWREASSPVARAWSESAADLYAYVGVTGQLPRQNGDTPDETRLGMWLANQRSACRSGEMNAGLGAARAAWLTKNLPDWEGRGQRDTVWERNARELGAWMGATDAGLWPNRRSADADERRLGTWLKNRRDDHRAGRLNGERVALLDQCAPGWQS